MSKIIAIIGMGLSGNAVFCRLIHLFAALKNLEEEIVINVYEENPEFFTTGFAYSVNSPDFWTLNNPAAGFKFISQTESLVEWINANSDFIQEHYSHIDQYYIPRSLVGHYLKAQYQKHKMIAKSLGIKVEEIFSPVSDVCHIKDGIYEVNSLNKVDKTDAIFLNTGHLKNDFFKGIEDKSGYIRFESTLNLEAMDIAEDVFVIGGQAAFVDAALWLTLRKGYQGKIHFVTRRTNILTTKGNTDLCDKRALNELSKQLKERAPNSLSFSEARNLFWTSYKSDAKNPVNQEHLPDAFQTLRYQMNKFDQLEEKDNSTGNIDELRDFIKNFYFDCYNFMWLSLSNEGKEEFSRYFYSLLMAYLTGITPINARVVLHLYEENKLIEHHGLEAVSYDKHSHCFKILLSSGEILYSKVIIDTTGYRYAPNLHTEALSLVDKLAQKGLIVCKPLGGIILSDSYQIIDSDKTLHDSVFCLGPVAKYNHPVPTPHSSFMVNDDVETAIKQFSTVLQVQTSKGTDVRVS